MTTENKILQASVILKEIAKDLSNDEYLHPLKNISISMTLGSENQSELSVEKRYAIGANKQENESLLKFKNE